LNHPYKLCVLTLTVLTLAACQSQVTPDRAAPPPTSEAAQPERVEVRKSPNDSREYRYLTLPNKLRMVLVSDPETQKSAAALAVYRGSFHEPEDRPGLAHFLEHMLFIQTETYPEIDGFHHHIRANGGASNAYTSLDHTNYFFDVRPAAFEEALDRFAHFFIDPIISAEYSAREKNAVDSEYQMQIKDDGWRGYMVGKRALNPDHPGSKFTIGTLETLDGDIHEDLMAFFETQYSSDQMGLVAISDQSLDQMQAWIEPLFAQIENKDIGSDYPTAPMYLETQLPAQLQYQTLKDGAAVSYVFPLPSTRTHYKNKPEQYFSNLMGHEGKGSLYDLLKSYGWIESLGASVGDLDRNNSILTIDIELTPQGRDKIENITDLLFQYIALIKQTPPQQWLFNEQARLAEIGFQFQEKSRPTGLVYQLAPRLDDYPAQDLLVAPYLMEQFDAAAISTFLTHINEQNVLIEIAAPDVAADSTEPWFQVPYSLEQVPLARAQTPGAALAMPDANPFLPGDLELKTNDAQPIVQVVDEPGLKLWLDTDSSFGSPRANVYLRLAVEGGFVNPRDRGMSQLYRMLVEDQLNEITYPAYLAGLAYGMSVPDTGFEIALSGYQDRQAALLQTLLDALLNAELQQDRFDALKLSLLKDWRNSAKDRPFHQVGAALSDTLRSGRWPRPQLIAALEPVTLADLESWRAEKLKSLAVRGLMHGNVGTSELSDLRSLLLTALPISDNAFTSATVRDIKAALRLEVPVDHNDAAILLHVQDDDESFASRARSGLAAQLLQPAYHQDLRTEQQLGYVVMVSNQPIAKRAGLSFIVQSPNTSAAGLENATVKFIDDFVSNWPDMTDEEFAQQQAGLVNRLTQTPKNLNERSQRYWADLTDDVYTFDGREQIAAHVQALNRADMHAYLTELRERMANRRLLIYTQGQFSAVPETGKLLSDATQRWEDVPQS